MLCKVWEAFYSVPIPFCVNKLLRKRYILISLIDFDSCKKLQSIELAGEIGGKLTLFLRLTQEQQMHKFMSRICLLEVGSSKKILLEKTEVILGRGMLFQLQI